MSFFRHEEIYRPMDSKNVPGRTCTTAPGLIGTMSFRLAIPRQVALPQSLPPLHQPRRILQELVQEYNRIAANGKPSLNSVSHSRGQPQNMMHLKTLHPPARLATPSISFQHLAAESPIGVRTKPQSWPFGPDPSQRVTCTFNKPLPLRLRKSNYQSSERRQKSILIPRFQAHSRQKIRADHLQAIPSGLVAPKHQARCLECLLDDRQLALVGLEIEDFPRFRFLAGQVLRDLPFEFLLGQFARFVQPGCTIEPLTVPPRHLR